MNLEQFSNVHASIEDGMFSDSVAKNVYNDSIKNRLTYKNSVEKTFSGTNVYVPSYSLDVVKTAGMSFNDGYFGDISDKLIVAQNNQHMSQMIKTFNDDAFSITSQGTPSYLTTIWTTKLFEVVTRTTIFDKISHSFQQGMFGITDIKIPTVSYTSSPALYSDYGVQGDSGINVNWINRQVVNFERLMVYGDLAVAQMSMGKIDYINQLRSGTLEQIKLHQDAIGFFGYSENMSVYGLLNDPSLSATLTAGIKASSGTTLWQGASFFEIIADIIKVRQAVTSRAGGNDEDDAKCFLLLPPAVWQYLLTTSPLGNITVKDWLKANYPNMELMKAPLLQGTGNPIGSTVPNQMVLIFDTIKGQPCLLNAYATLYNSHGVERLASSFQEKASYSLGGAIVSNAIGIQIMQGI
jgi:hypothetical protein